MELFKFLGGTLIGSGVIVFLAKYILEKGFDTYKVKYQSELEKERINLQNNLELAKLNHQIKFS